MLNSWLVIVCFPLQVAIHIEMGNLAAQTISSAESPTNNMCSIHAQFKSFHSSSSFNSHPGGLPNKNTLLQGHLDISHLKWEHPTRKLGQGPIPGHLCTWPPHGCKLTARGGGTCTRWFGSLRSCAAPPWQTWSAGHRRTRSSPPLKQLARKTRFHLCCDPRITTKRIIKAGRGLEGMIN